MKIRGFLFVLLLFVFEAHFGWAGSETDSSDPHYSKPKSTFKASSDVQYFGSSGAQTIEHVNVTVDDTRASDTVILPEKTEFRSKNTITVLNNMGSSGSGSIYSAEGLDSKTGAPTEKKGVVEIPYGDSAVFTTSGTKIIKRTLSSDEGSDDPDAAETSDVDAPKGPRVLVSD